jgi:extradiol dioxygenase
VTVRALGYVGIEASDLGAWRSFGSDRVGFDVRDDGDTVRLRMDERLARLILHEGPADDIRYVGFDVAGPEGLEAAAARLADVGVPFRQGTPDEVASRQVLDLLVTADPDGLQLEVGYGHLLEPRSTFVPGRPHAGFSTGELGLGHVVLAVSDLQVAIDFYTSALGFRLTDIVRFGPSSGRTGEVVFLHCNARHHSVALVKVPDGRRLRHVMLEYRLLDDLGLGLELSTEAGELTRTLGLHTNDKTLSYYVRTPSGFEFEIGWGSKLVDDDSWQAGHYDDASVWGHERLSRPA